MIMHPKPLTESIAWLVEDLLRKREAYARMQRRKKTKENDAMLATYRASMARIRNQITELLDEGEPAQEQGSLPVGDCSKFNQLEN